MQTFWPIFTKRSVTAIFVLVFLIATQAAPAALAETNAPLDTIPTTLVSSGVTGFTTSAPKIFWNTTHELCPPADVNSAAAGPTAVNTPYHEIIQRVSIYGTEPRTLYDNDTGSCAVFNLYSNIVADSNYVYWMGPAGLMRLSVNANVGDAPQVQNSTVSGRGELAIDSDNVYFLKVTGSNPNYTTNIYRVPKTAASNVAIAPLITRSAYGTNLAVSHAYSFITSTSRDFLYWLESGTLMLFNLNTNGLSTKDTGVTAFFAEGGRFSCSGIICITTDRVYYSKGNKVYVFNNGGSSSLYYTSPDTVYAFTSDADHLFMLEDHFVPCSPQPCIGGNHTSFVTRRNRTTGTVDYLFTGTPDFFSPSSRELTTLNGYLVWHEYDKLLRLPNNASALALTNMRVTGISITQGIQDASNTVVLIQGRRTFVRVFAQSDGAAVSGVTARLYLTDSNGNKLDSLAPVNSVGTNLTVRPAPNRANLNDSFLFELPWSWLNSGLRLRAEVNPFHAPPQASYANNAMTAGPFTFQPSAALKVNFVAWIYNFNNTSYTPRFIKDIIQTYSWIIRAYPLASKISFSQDNTPGLHPNLWFVNDDQLGAMVNRSHSGCQDLLVKNSDGTTKSDDRNLCASRYTNTQMVVMRSENGLPAKRFFYGMISDGLKFPRGQACCGEAVSSGPVGIPGGGSAWDMDGAYGDWYAAHEIAHTLGRAHPNPNSDDPATKNTVEGCGHSRSDPSYPHANAEIGANNNTEGFDVGDPSLGIPRAIYPGTVWHDVMSYCNNQWVSDYTYTGMYNFMQNSPPPDERQFDLMAGDWLAVGGTIMPDTNTASFQLVERLDTNTYAPPLVAGGYAIRLFNAADGQLASHSFTPSEMEGSQSGALTFSQTVPFAAGTRTIKIVRLRDGVILATKTLSANAPVVSNVALQGSPSPVTGVVTLGWTATDLDSDPLTFSVQYSHDGGASFQTVAQGITATTAQIDTAALGGSPSAVFKVVASDGVNSGSANSAPFTMANKAPQVFILTPGPTTNIHYGQLVNFSGTALDFQDGGVTGAGLVWKLNGTTTLGTGELLSADELPVGTNTVTLTATNSKGLTASTSVTIIVDDELDLLGPTLTAGPTQFSWSFGEGATTLEAQTLAIGNAGSDVLNWTLTSDVTWLNIDLPSGSDVGTVTLTVDPAALANGTAAVGMLTLTAEAVGNNPEQVIQIPVSYSKGLNPYNQPSAPPESGFRVMIPLVVR